MYLSQTKCHIFVSPSIPSIIPNTEYMSDKFFNWISQLSKFTFETYLAYNFQHYREEREQEYPLKGEPCVLQHRILLHKDIIHRQDSVLPVSLEVLFSIEKKKATSLWSVLLIQFSLTVPNSEFEIVQYKNITDDKTTLNAQVLLLVYTYEDSILSYVSFKPCSLQESIKWDYLKF